MRRILFFFTLFASCTPASAPSEAEAVFAQSATVRVSKVADGDTFEFRVYSDTIAVRVLGVDTYESRRGDRITGQAAKANISVDSALVLGKKAKAFADSLLTGKEVVISRRNGQGNFDVYGRLLRDVAVGGQDYAGLLRKRGFVVP